MLTVVLLLMWASLSTATPPLFEKQEGNMCQKHAINNMFQKKVIADCEQWEHIRQNAGGAANWLRGKGYTVNDVSFRNGNDQDQFLPSFYVASKIDRLEGPLDHILVSSTTRESGQRAPSQHIATIIKKDGTYWLLDSFDQKPLDLGISEKEQLAYYIANTLYGGPEGHGVAKHDKKGEFFEKAFQIQQVIFPEEQLKQPQAPEKPKEAEQPKEPEKPKEPEQAKEPEQPKQPEQASTNTDGQTAGAKKLSWRNELTGDVWEHPRTVARHPHRRRYRQRRTPKYQHSRLRGY